MRLVTTDPAIELAARLDDLRGAIVETAVAETAMLLNAGQPRPSGRGCLRLCV